MAGTDPPPSARRAELLEHAYRYVLDRGVAGLSLRPLAAAIGSSPRVLLFLFGSKDGLVHALLTRARADELTFFAQLGEEGDRPDPGQPDRLVAAGERVWAWLADERHRGLLTVWVEAYARSLVEPDGPWAPFARQTVADWLAVLADAQPPAERRTATGEARRTAVLAVLRGAMLDLLATGDLERTTAAVRHQLRAAGPAAA
jgi:AcrR family transcriptional regulator